MNQTNVPVREFIIQLDNYEKCQEILERGPYIRRMDLALSCYEVLVNRGGDLISVKVTWDMLESMDISPERLFELAEAYCRTHLPAEVKRLDELLTGLQEQMAETSEEGAYDPMVLPELFVQGLQVYALTNPRYVRGAAALFYTDAVNQLAEMCQSDLILLPSSIHEWLIMPETADVDLEETAKMVREINATVVLEKDFLSDNIYRYVRHKHEIEMIENV